jgi:hypothetical protein
MADAAPAERLGRLRWLRDLVHFARRESPRQRYQTPRALNVCLWFLPWLSILIISTSLAYPVNAILSTHANADSKTLHAAPEIYMGLGIEQEQEAQTPTQLAAAGAALSDAPNAD